MRGAGPQPDALDHHDRSASAGRSAHRRPHDPPAADQPPRSTRELFRDTHPSRTVALAVGTAIRPATHHYPGPARARVTRACGRRPARRLPGADNRSHRIDPVTTRGPKPEQPGPSHLRYLPGRSPLRTQLNPKADRCIEAKDVSSAVKEGTPSAAWGITPLVRLGDGSRSERCQPAHPVPRGRAPPTSESD
jgi:hypothetical protein